MSLPHVFLDEQVIAHETDLVFQLRLSGDDAKHLRVLRIAPGEHLAVVDGAQDYFECEVVSFDADGCFVSISSHLDSPVRPQVVLVQGLAKGEKMDSVVRHATEVGVSGIIPLACSRSIVKLDAKKSRNRCDSLRPPPSRGEQQNHFLASRPLHENREERRRNRNERNETASIGDFALENLGAISGDISRRYAVPTVARQIAERGFEDRFVN